MPTLVKEACLEDKTLTNHCIRSTCITILDNKGFEARHIMSVSGHKREESIKSYATKVSETKKREMSDALASEIIQPKKQKVAPNVTSSESVVVHQPNFDLSFRDLLELSPEEEDKLVKELFEDVTLDNSVANMPSSQQLNVTSNVQNVSSLNPNNQQIVPKLLFQNSNVTINFNINKN